MELETELLNPACTVSELAGKLLYLLRLSEPAAEQDRKHPQKSWRYRLLHSAVTDAERIAAASGLMKRYEQLRREFHKAQNLAREQTKLKEALQAELQERQLQLTQTQRVRGATLATLHAAALRTPVSAESGM